MKYTRAYEKKKIIYNETSVEGKSSNVIIFISYRMLYIRFYIGLLLFPIHFSRKILVILIYLEPMVKSHLRSYRNLPTENIF